MKRLDIAYVPLSDAAVLIAAVEKGFAVAQGLEVVLSREASWANVRDKLALGLVDAAHMLAPLALATHLGIGGQLKRSLVVPYRLNLNGNAITVSADLKARLQAEGFTGAPSSLAPALKRVVMAGEASGRPPLIFASVYPFSTHAYQIALLLERAGLTEADEVRHVVVPPAYTVEALRSGLVDGFCVGGPWNSVAVESGLGHIVAFGTDIVARCPEKVLAVPAETDLDTISALARALAAASSWCTAPENRPELAAILSRHLGVSIAIVERTLSGTLVVSPDGETRTEPNYLLLGGGDVGRPDPHDARWCLDRMRAAGQLPASAAEEEAALALYRPDLYDHAVGH